MRGQHIASIIAKEGGTWIAEDSLRYLDMYAAPVLEYSSLQAARKQKTFTELTEDIRGQSGLLLES